jgi:hypothetical protein
MLNYWYTVPAVMRWQWRGRKRPFLAVIIHRSVLSHPRKVLRPGNPTHQRRQIFGAERYVSIYPILTPIRSKRISRALFGMQNHQRDAAEGSSLPFGANPWTIEAGESPWSEHKARRSQTQFIRPTVSGNCRNGLSHHFFTTLNLSAPNPKFICPKP